MEKSLLEISSKYILKNIFSYLKVIKALKIIKSNKKIRTKLEIPLFFYQYYFFFSLFKAIKIESLDDILNSPYLEYFPKDAKYELLCKFVETRKLFTENDYIYLKFDDRDKISFMRK